MKKILVITGRKGEGELRKILSRVGKEVDLHVCDLDVAAFLTSEIIGRELASLIVITQAQSQQAKIMLGVS